MTGEDIEVVKNLQTRNAWLSEVRRGNDGKLYVNYLPESFTGTFSKLGYLDNLVSSDVNDVKNSWDHLDMGSGNSNYGLPLIPFRRFDKTIKWAKNKSMSYRILGNKEYELTDHLGNVRATFSDSREWNDGGTSYVLDADEGELDVKSWADYYSFGMIMPGRSDFSSSEYRYGFGGQEKDNEVSGVGNAYTAEFWQYDSRLGRRWNVDPLASEAPGWSPYRAFFCNPSYWTDPTGLFEDNYSVDDQGNVTLEEETDDDFDMLYTKSDWDAGNKDNGLKVNDRSILPDLTKSRSDFNGNYAISDNKSELFNIFYFAVENTNVEWGLTGHRMEGGNEYVLRTSGDRAGYGSGGVSSILTINRYDNVFSLIFDLHSHPSGGTQGASQVDGLYDDMDIVRQRYYDFRDAGMTNTNTWFKKNDTWTVFPKHYVYPKGSGVLYHYDPWDNDVFIRRVTKPSDLYRNLGF